MTPSVSAYMTLIISKVYSGICNIYLQPLIIFTHIGTPGHLSLLLSYGDKTVIGQESSEKTEWLSGWQATRQIPRLVIFVRKVIFSGCLHNSHTVKTTKN